MPDTNQGKKIMRKLKNLMKALFCLMLVVIFSSCDRTMKYFDASEFEKAGNEICVFAVNQYDVALEDSYGEYNRCTFRDEQYEYEGFYTEDLECIAIFFLSNPPSIKFPDGKYAEHMLYLNDGYLYHNLEDMRKEKRRGRIKVKLLYANDIAVDQFEKANERKKYK